MAKCARCGRSMGSAAACPSCGHGPSDSVLNKGVGKAAKVTGKVIDTGIDVTETVIRETKPIVKSVLGAGKRGAQKARDGARKVAKGLKDE